MTAWVRGCRPRVVGGRPGWELTAGACTWLELLLAAGEIRSGVLQPLLVLKIAASADVHVFAVSAQQAEDFGGLVIGGSEPVWDASVELRDFAGIEATGGGTSDSCGTAERSIRDCGGRRVEALTVTTSRHLCC